jgi:hypothetical protein
MSRQQHGRRPPPTRAAESDEDRHLNFLSTQQLSRTRSTSPPTPGGSSKHMDTHHVSPQQSAPDPRRAPGSDRSPAVSPPRLAHDDEQDQDIRDERNTLKQMFGKTEEMLASFRGDDGTARDICHAFGITHDRVGENAIANALKCVPSQTERNTLRPSTLKTVDAKALSLAAAAITLLLKTWMISVRESKGRSRNSKAWY